MKHRLIVALCLLLVVLSSHAYRFRAFIPKENPTGTGVIVCPGGSYFWVDKQGEGDEVAQWFCDHGIAAFVVEYSHGGWASFTFHVYLKKRRFHGILCRRSSGDACRRAVGGNTAGTFFRGTDVSCGLDDASCHPQAFPSGTVGWFSYWGDDVSHDWHWWRHQLEYFIPPLLDHHAFINQT